MAAQKTPLLSVVIPVRNGMPYLEEAVKSALAQLTPAMEIIVRDNWSTDGTLDFLTSLNDSRIRIIEAPEPASAGENWSALCSLANGTYTKLLCADDTLLPGGLGRQLRAAMDHPRAALVASRRCVIDEAGKVVIRSHGLPGLIGEFEGSAAIRKAVLSGNNPFGEPAAVLFRTDALKDSLPFTEEFSYLTDFDIYVKVLQHGSLVGLETVDATFRLSTTSWSQSIGRSQLAETRGWIRSLLASGVLTLSTTQRGLLNAKVFAKYLARRAVTTVTPLLAAMRH